MVGSMSVSFLKRDVDGLNCQELALTALNI